MSSESESSAENTRSNTPINPRHAIVVGAGPSGILITINLLKLGWKVTLIEKDASIADASVFERIKSWNISISTPGENALSSVEGLWDHLKDIIKSTKSANVYLFGRHQTIDFPASLVDRNELVSNMLKFLFGLPEASNLDVRFESKVAFVDGRSKKVGITRSGDVDKVEVIGYDFLIGADGSRSVVRNSLFSQNPNFKSEQSLIFQTFRSAYVPIQEGVNPNEFYLYPGLFNGANLMLMPAPKGRMNVIVAGYDNQVLDEGLISTDPYEFQAYVNSKIPNFKFNLEACEKLVKSDWYQVTQVKCGPYHMNEKYGCAVLIGDAAHATSPGMGMGLNMALQDAEYLSKLLKGQQESGESMDELLQNYSDARVKVGYALTDMSFLYQPIKMSRLIKFEIKNTFRRLANKITGGRVTLPVRELYGAGIPLDEMYRMALTQSYDTIRQENLQIIRKFEERMIGLIPHSAKSELAYAQRRFMHSKDVFHLRNLKK